MTHENEDPQANVAVPTADVGEQLAALHRKLDVIQSELETRNRQLAEFRELQEDLAGVAKDMFQTAVVELDEVAPFIQTGDFLALLKRLLRNVTRNSESLGTLESAADFAADAQPIAHAWFHRFILQMDQLERMGYFQVAEQVRETGDALVQTLVQSNLLPAVQQGLQSVQQVDPQKFEGYSLLKFYRETRSPEVRRMLGWFVELLRAVAREMPAEQVEQVEQVVESSR